MVMQRSSSGECLYTRVGSTAGLADSKPGPTAVAEVYLGKWAVM